MLAMTFLSKRKLSGPYIFLNTRSPTDSFPFWVCAEFCIDLFVFVLIQSFRRRDTGVTSNRLSFGLKGTKKRLNKIMLFAYPRAHMIFTELMWSMYSVATLLRCALSSFGAIYCLLNMVSWRFLHFRD